MSKQEANSIKKATRYCVALAVCNELYRDAIFDELAKFPYPRTIQRLKILCTATADIQAALYFDNIA